MKREHGARGKAHHPIRGAAEQRLPEAGAPARGQDDKVRFSVPGRGDNLLERQPPANLQADGNRRRQTSSREFLEQAKSVPAGAMLRTPHRDGAKGPGGEHRLDDVKQADFSAEA